MYLLLGTGLCYNEKANAPGAQTERQGLVGPVRDMLGGLTSPANFEFTSLPSSMGWVNFSSPTLNGFCYNCVAIHPILAEVFAMAITVEAVYENGVLKPAQSLPLKEHEIVQVTVEQAQPSLVERIAARAHALPRETLDRLPKDGASQHDHYIYGTPKRPE